jgi:hypothetical protein
MQSPEALVAALAIRRHPHMLRKVRRSILPRGLTFLLEVAAGESEALQAAMMLTGQPKALLQDAAGFFIEQILLSPHSNSYRTLGTNSDSSLYDLRRHMALLMRWLHPDVVATGAIGQGFDRSVFANRVTGAWEAIKTSERRAAYNLKLVAESQQIKAKGSRCSGNADRTKAIKTASASMAHRIGVPNMSGEKSPRLIDRIFLLLGGLR